MKIILDTLEKVIKINESVTLGEFVETLERILPMGEWKEFRLEVDVSINLQWVTPIILKEYINIYSHPSYPWYKPFPDVTCTSKADCLVTGRYCVEG